MMQDPNDEPQYGERVPYVIIRGQPNSRLLDRAVAPLELLDNWYFLFILAGWASLTMEWN
jgi:hypothetical protein